MQPKNHEGSCSTRFLPVLNAVKDMPKVTVFSHLCPGLLLHCLEGFGAFRCMWLITRLHSSMWRKVGATESEHLWFLSTCTCRVNYRSRGWNRVAKLKGFSSATLNFPSSYPNIGVQYKAVQSWEELVEWTLADIAFWTRKYCNTVQFNIIEEANIIFKGTVSQERLVRSDLWWIDNGTAKSRSFICFFPI